MYVIKLYSVYCVFRRKGQKRNHAICGAAIARTEEEAIAKFKTKFILSANDYKIIEYHAHEQFDDAFVAMTN